MRDILSDLYREIAALQDMANKIAKLPEKKRVRTGTELGQDLLLNIGEAEAARNRRNRALAKVMGLKPISQRCILPAAHKRPSGRRR